MNEAVERGLKEGSEKAGWAITNELAKFGLVERDEDIALHYSSTIYKVVRHFIQKAEQEAPKADAEE